jgi:hypothetical protein
MILAKKKKEKKIDDVYQYMTSHNIYTAGECLYWVVWATTAGSEEYSAQSGDGDWRAYIEAVAWADRSVWHRS